MELNLRRNRITDGVKNQLIRYSSKELVVDKVGSFDKIKLGFGLLESKLQNIYIKYEGLGKRRVWWTIWENRRGNYSWYEEFHKS